MKLTKREKEKRITSQRDAAEFEQDSRLRF
jgi:hypothetical protein